MTDDVQRRAASRPLSQECKQPFDKLRAFDAACHEQGPHSRPRRMAPCSRASPTRHTAGQLRSVFRFAKLYCVAERAGVEPAVPFWGTYDFQSYTFGHSVTSPVFSKNVTCHVRFQSHSIPTLWPQVRVAHVAAAGALTGLAPAGAVALLRPFLAPPPALVNGHSVTSP